MIKLYLSLKSSFFEVAMYLIAGVGILATFATFTVATHLYINYHQDWLYDFVPWMAGTTFWATSLCHYFLTRSDHYLASIDNGMMANRQKIANKKNNKLFVGLANAMIFLFPMLLSNIGIYRSFGGGPMRLSIQILGIISLYAGATWFGLSKGSAEKEWRV